MDSQQKNKLHKGLAITIFVLLFLVFVGMLIPCELCWKDKLWAEILKIIFSSCASVFGIGAVWEIVNITKIVKQVSEDIKSAEDIKKSGITDYQNSFQSIEWEIELKNVSKITTLFLFGNQWAIENEKALIKVSEKIIILPDYKVQDVLHDISVKLNNKNEDDVKKDIITSIGKFLHLGAKIKLYNKLPSFSYYLFGSTLIASPYYNEPTKSGTDLPVFKLMESENNYNFYSMCKNDLAKILEISRDLSEEEKLDIKHAFENSLHTIN